MIMNKHITLWLWLSFTFTNLQSYSKNVARSGFELGWLGEELV